MRGHWRRVGLALIVLSSVIGATGLSSFSTVSAGQPTDVAVAPADDAYLAVNSEPVALDTGRNRGVELATVTNNFNAKLDAITVTIDDETATPPNVLQDTTATPSRLHVDESGTITADIVCGANARNTEKFTLSIHAQGPATTIQTTHQVTVDCPDAPVRNGNGNGNGQ